MKYSVDLAEQLVRPRRRGKSRLALTLVLALLCVGGMELAFCYFFSPVLFHRITDPVVRPVVQAVQAAQAQVRLWQFEYARDNLTDNVSVRLGEYFTPHPVTHPRPAPQVSLPTPTPLPTPAVTQLVQENGRTILTGGLPCVYYNQNDPAWRDQPFGSDPLGPYGCGPTAMSMVVSTLTDQPMDPAQMAVWAYEHDYWCAGSGAYLTIVEGASKAFGLDCVLNKQCDPAALTSHLKAGGMAIALMGPGHFSELGHFILLHGVTEEGKVLVADPASRENSLTLWDPQLIVKEATKEGEVRMWLIKKPGA